MLILNPHTLKTKIIPQCEKCNAHMLPVDKYYETWKCPECEKEDEPRQSNQIQ